MGCCVYSFCAQLIRSTAAIRASEPPSCAAPLRTPHERHALLTGMQRSGTTLLEKLIGLHPDVDARSRSRYFVGGEETPARLGRATSDIPCHSSRRRPAGDLIGIWRACSKALASPRSSRRCRTLRSVHTLRSSTVEQALPAASSWVSPNSSPGYHALQPDLTAGGKETICEEFLPYLSTAAGVCGHPAGPARRGGPLNHGRGTEYGGQLPTPSTSNWRKSVAYSASEGREGFLWQLRRRRRRSPGGYARITQALGSPISRPDIRWSGNSHGERSGVSAESIERTGEFRRRSPGLSRRPAYPNAASATRRPWGERNTQCLREFEEPYEITVRESQATWLVRPTAFRSASP
jgi:hypothetical protein